MAKDNTRRYMWHYRRLWHCIEKVNVSSMVDDIKTYNSFLEAFNNALECALRNGYPLDFTPGNTFAKSPILHIGLQRSDLVKALLDKGADVNVTNAFNQNCLIFYCSRVNPNDELDDGLFKQIVEQTDDINKIDTQHRCTAFQYLVSAYSVFSSPYFSDSISGIVLPKAKIMIDAGADIDHDMKDLLSIRNPFRLNRAEKQEVKELQKILNLYKEQTAQLSNTPNYCLYDYEL